MEKSLKRRVIVVSCVLGLVLGCLASRLFYVQVKQHERFATLAEKRFVGTKPLPASRGRILDRTGDPVAQSQTVYDLVADPVHLRYERYMCNGVALREGIHPSEVRRRYGATEIYSKYLSHIVDSLKEPLRYRPDELRAKLEEPKVGEIVLTSDIEEDFRLELTQVIRDQRLRGISFREVEKRYYPSPFTLTQVIGHVDFEGDGKAGIEKTFDHYMQGVDGERAIQHDRAGREIVAFRGATKMPKSGADVQLTIDGALQSYVEETLDEVVSEYSPEKVSIIMVRPQTGEILAMASRPHFDLSTRKGTTRNIAVSDLYEPGSTFKVIAASAALDIGVVEPTTRIDCEMGSYKCKNYVVPDHSPFGWLSVEEVLGKSSNIGIFKIAQQVHPGIFIDYVKRFGFGSETGIPLTAEAGGVVHEDHRKWHAPDYASMTRGYSISVTPLQIVSAYAAIANDGVLMKPMIVRRVVGSDGEVIEEYAPTEVRRVIRSKTAKQMAVALNKVTGDGFTGKRARIEGYDVAGKTGTALKPAPNGGYLKGRYIVSFAGFLPAEDPQIAALVVLDDPQVENGSVGGGTIAAPIFKKIATYATRRFSIPTNEELVTTASVVKEIK